MNKLFYEIKESFKPEFYMVMGCIRDAAYQPVVFCEVSGHFVFGELNYNPNLSPDVPMQIYDYDTATALLAHHTINSDTELQLRLVPVFVPEIISGASSSPYLNRFAPNDALCERIKQSADFCRSENPGEWNESFDLPDSLGGGVVVPALERKGHSI